MFSPAGGGWQVVGYKHVPLGSSLFQQVSQTHRVVTSFLGHIWAASYLWSTTDVSHLYYTSCSCCGCCCCPCILNPFWKVAVVAATMQSMPGCRQGLEHSRGEWGDATDLSYLLQMCFSALILCVALITQVGVRYFCQVWPKLVEKTRESPRNKPCHHLCNIRQLCLGKPGDLVGEQRHGMGSLHLPWLYALLCASLVKNPTSAWKSRAG